MKQAVTKTMFSDAFRDAGRKDQFSYQGLSVLFEYLTDFEEQTDTEIELDVIGLCCEYSEDEIKNVLKYYSLETLEELENETTVLKVDDETIIYLNY